MQKPKAAITVLIHPTDNATPWAAVTEFGETIRYATLESLQRALDFVFGRCGWRETERRLG